MRIRGLFDIVPSFTRYCIAMFQSALRIRGLFDPGPRHSRLCYRHVSIRLADSRPFRLDHLLEGGLDHPAGFNPPCGFAAFSTEKRAGGRGGGDVSIRLADSRPFRRGPGQVRPQSPNNVSIRLADSRPFRLVVQRGRRGHDSRFNPPCGFAAFSTASRELLSGLFGGFNPPCGFAAFSTNIRAGRARAISAFQSALRIRGLFDGRGPCSSATGGGFQSALRIRGLFDGCLGNVVTVSIGFNPPCGFAAFSTGQRDAPTVAPMVFQSALRIRGLFDRFWFGMPVSWFVVSIRLADSRPFRLIVCARASTSASFNPPCGFAAFSTPRAVGYPAGNR